jgi:hypothetical protein
MASPCQSRNKRYGFIENCSLSARKNDKLGLYATRKMTSRTGCLVDNLCTRFDNPKRSLNAFYVIRQNMNTKKWSRFSSERGFPDLDTTCLNLFGLYMGRSIRTGLSLCLPLISPIHRHSLSWHPHMHIIQMLGSLPSMVLDEILLYLVSVTTMAEFVDNLYPL